MAFTNYAIFHCCSTRFFIRNTKFKTRRSRYSITSKSLTFYKTRRCPARCCGLVTCAILFSTSEWQHCHLPSRLWFGVPRSQKYPVRERFRVSWLFRNCVVRARPSFGVKSVKIAAKMSYGRPPPRIEGMVSLKVDNLTYRTTPEDLRRAFERCGEVGDVYIPRDRFTRESRGFAFVR